MRMRPADRREVEGLVQRSIWALLFSIALSVVFFAGVGATLIVGAGVLILSGMLFAGLVIYSWRHYHPYWSWLIWAIPGPALVLSTFQLLVFPLAASGVISVFVALMGLFGCAGVGYFGTLFALRSHVSRWVNADGT